MPAADSTKQTPAAQKPPAKRPAAKKPVPKVKIKNNKPTIARAIRELGINVPIYSTRVIGGRLQLKLYGGQVLYWPASKAKAKT